jgi:ferric-dicitrate binding protein FerR (iron transport regulator)
MKGEQLSQRAQQALQPFRHLGTPVEDDGVVAARREELVPLIGSSIRRVAVRRIRWRRARSAFAIAGLAAGFALVTAQSYRWLTGSDKSEESHNQASSALLAAGGPVSLTRHGRPIGAGDEPQKLHVGDQIDTPANTPTSLVLVGGVRAEVAVSTRVTLVRNEEREQRLKLAFGRVELEVPKLAPGRAFVVETPHAEVRVRGTRFSVEVAAGGAALGVTRVGVTRGSVLVRTARGERALIGGENWSSFPHTTAAERGEISAPADPPASDQPRIVPAASPTGLAPSGSSARGDKSAALDEAAPGRRLEERVARRSDERSVPSESASTPRARPAEPAESRSRADSDALAQQNRMMQAALAARSKGEHARAVQLFDELLRRHPGSPLTESVRVERFRSLRRLGRHAEATREARRYLAIYGRGFARDEARGLVLDPEDPERSAPKR